MARIHLSGLINKIYGREEKGVIWRKLTVLVNTSESTMVNFCAMPGCSSPVAYPGGGGAQGA